jgi:hypothetical protein
MGAQARTRLNQLATGVLGLTGAAPQTGAGGRLPLATVEPGYLQECDCGDHDWHIGQDKQVPND